MQVANVMTMMMSTVSVLNAHHSVECRLKKVWRGSIGHNENENENEDENASTALVM